MRFQRHHGQAALRTLFLALAVSFADPSAAPAPASGAPAPKTDCARHSDSFDIFQPEKWDIPLRFTRDQGAVVCQNGYLALVAPSDTHVDIETASRFFFTGDFDVECEIETADTKNMDRCQFFGGIALRPAGGAVSYEAHVTYSPRERLSYRAWWERAGTAEHENVKGAGARFLGGLRFTREGGKIACYSKNGTAWDKIAVFKEECPDPLSVVFLFKSGGRRANPHACAGFLRVHDFKVGFCQGAVEKTGD
jgi:hypothetical protein